MPSRRYHRRDKLPFGVNQIARVSQAASIRARRRSGFYIGRFPKRIMRLIRNHIRFIRLKKFPDRLNRG